MNRIWELVAKNSIPIDVVMARATEMGFTDLGHVAQTATNDQRVQLHGILSTWTA